MPSNSSGNASDPTSSLLSSNWCSIYYSNCCSLVPKLDHLQAIAASVAPTVIAACETWLDETVPDSILFIPNYHIIRRNRNRHGGGLLLYIHDDIPSTCLHRHATLELLTVELRLRQGPLLIVLYYRPPSSAPIFDNLEDALVPLTTY